MTDSQKLLCRQLAALAFLISTSCGSGGSSGTQTLTGAVEYAQLSLPTTSINLGPVAGATGAALLTLTTGTQAPWNASTNTPWIHLPATSGTTGALGSVVRFSYDANPAGTRTGTITLTGTAFNQALTVTQAGTGYVSAIPPLTTINVPAPSTSVDLAGNFYSVDCTANTLTEWVAATGTTSTLKFPSACGSVLVTPNDYFVEVGNASSEWFSGTPTSIAEWPIGTQTETTVPNLPAASPSGTTLCGLASDLAGNAYGCDTANGFTVFNLANPATAIVNVPSFMSTGFTFDALGNLFAASDSAIIQVDTASGQVTTLVNLDNIFLEYTSSLQCPAVDGSGTLYFSATQNGSGGVPTQFVVTWSPSTGYGFNSPITVVGGTVCPFGDGLGNIYVYSKTLAGVASMQKLTPTFVNTSNVSEPAAAGSDRLPPVIPSSTQLNATSDSPWLTITSQTNGVVSFSFTAATAARNANITLLGETITVSQDEPTSSLVSSLFAQPGENGLFFHPIPVCRLIEAEVTGIRHVNAVRNSCHIPASAQSLLISTTETNESKATSKSEIVPAKHGEFDAYTARATHLTIDALGYFAP